MIRRILDRVSSYTLGATVTVGTVVSVGKTEIEVAVGIRVGLVTGIELTAGVAAIAAEQLDANKAIANNQPKYFIPSPFTAIEPNKCFKSAL